jgi:hypothetical protein
MVGDRGGALPRYEVHRRDNTQRHTLLLLLLNQMAGISSKDMIVYVILDAINTTVY